MLDLLLLASNPRPLATPRKVNVKKRRTDNKSKKRSYFPLFLWRTPNADVRKKTPPHLGFPLFAPFKFFIRDFFVPLFCVSTAPLFLLPYAAAATHPHQNVCRWDGEDEGGAHMCECVFHKMRRGRDLKTNSPNLNARFERMVTTFGTVTRAY